MHFFSLLAAKDHLAISCSGKSGFVAEIRGGTGRMCQTPVAGDPRIVPTHPVASANRLFVPIAGGVWAPSAIAKTDGTRPHHLMGRIVEK